MSDRISAAEEAAYVERIENLIKRAKAAMDARLEAAPAAEASRWLGARWSVLTRSQMALANTIAGWTLGQGPKWVPVGGVSFRQFVAALGKDPLKRAGYSTVDRGIDGLIRKDVVRRIRRTRHGPTQADWFRLTIVDEVLRRHHRHHDDDVGREEADDVLAELEQAETDSERLWQALLQERERSACAPRRERLEPEAPALPTASVRIPEPEAFAFPEGKRSHSEGGSVRISEGKRSHLDANNSLTSLTRISHENLSYESSPAPLPEPDPSKVVKLPPPPRTKVDVPPEERERSLAAMDEASQQVRRLLGRQGRETA